MDHSDEVLTFLKSRRAKVSPRQAGIDAEGDDRRVPGLRREEVAALAGMSTDYYKRLERGSLRGVSEAVLEALSEALQLDEAERTYLENLSRAANQTMRSRSRAVNHALLDSEVELLLNQVAVPAIIRNGVLDILSINDIGRALFAELYGHPAAGANAARSMFLDPRARSFWVDWEDAARSTAAMLRTQLGRYPGDLALQRLTSELSLRSEDFRRIWALHDVGFDRSGRRVIRHGHEGDIECTFQSLHVAREAGPLTIVTFSTEAGSPSESALQRLASVYA